MEKANELCKELRTKSGMSKSQLSKELGVSPSHVSNIESGRTPISKDIAERYALLFGEQYLDPLTEDLVRFLVDPVALDNIMKTKGIKVVDAAKAFGVRWGSFDILLRPKGDYCKLLSNHEVEDLAFYLGVPISKLNPKRTIMNRTPSKHTELKLQKKEEAPVAVNKFSYTVDKSGCVKATAVSTSDELKAQLKKYSEYCDAKDKENSELKAKLAEIGGLKKDVDILKEENDHLKKDCDEWSMMYNAQRGRIDELEKANEQYKDIEKERDKAVDAYDNLSNLYGSLSKEAKEKDALINELSKINQDLKKKVDSVDYALASDYKTVSAELARYKDILLEILLEQRKAK